jgi:hypothetical protein
MRLFDYIIVCKSPDFKNVDRISQFMLLLSVSGFSFGLYKGFFNMPSLVYAIITSIISWSIYCYFQKKNGGIPYYRLGLLFASWGWLLLPKALIISGIFLIGALFERQVKFPYEIAFDPTGIIVNTFPKKFFPWGAIQNAIIKDPPEGIKLDIYIIALKEVEKEEEAITIYNELIGLFIMHILLIIPR